MLELRDYLDLTVADAKAQWQSILDRQSVSTGARQGDFTAIETLLCFGLGLITSPGRSGRINLRETDTNVLRLAVLFKRAPGSLALKLANLDGRRENGAKHEQELWIALTSSEGLLRFQVLYAVVMEAGRSLGLDYRTLPDFLGEESRSFQTVLEADQISTPDLMESIDDEIREWYDTHPGGDLVATEKALLGTARVGQKQFAYSVLANCDFACVFCGLGFRSAGLPSSKMLVASHIKSWRFSDSRERLDIRNGVAACPTHDAAFDSFLISATDDLRILRTELLTLAIQQDSVIAKNFGPEALGAALQLSATAKAPLPSYLEWHRKKSSEFAGELS